MADLKPEKIEPDPSSTGIANDLSVNTGATVEESNPTAAANSKIETEMPSTDEVEKAMAEVESRKQQKEAAKEAKVEAKVEANGHAVPEQKDIKTDGDQKEPSQRVQEGQRWNNRDSKPRVDHKKNYKSDLTSQAESSDPVEIRKQVEFYFSDSNLLQDKFLFSKVQGHDNLPVPISTIHSFKRMRHFQPYSAVIEALKESATLNVVENDQVQRKTPLPEGLKDKPMDEVQKVFEDETMKRSVYVKGFGEEQPSTQFDIEAFFAAYGSTNSVRLRRGYTKLFKGSVFVEFDSEETQKQFLSLDPQPKWKGQDLMIKSKKEYCDAKVEDIKAGRVKARGFDEKHNQGGDKRDWKTRRDEDQRNGHRRGGGGKGFGSHKGGRGRGGDRRGRDEGRKYGRDERNVPTVATTAAPDKDVTKATTNTEDAPRKDDADQPSTGKASEIPPNSASKKRAREEAEPEEGQASKKLDNKAENS
ncbi:MAG: hypothetical protein Q9186_001485 [Xanthomendoza sp. 1 TL-2023]